MAQTSIMRELGSRSPDFSLTDVRTGATVSRSDYEGRPLAVIFICNHCPYVKRIQGGLADLGRDYADSEAAIVAISSNDPEGYPDDSPSELARIADELGFAFPVLFDEDQSIAKAFEAQCTPDIYVFDREHRLAYRGQFDDARPRNDVPVTGADLRSALDAVIAGEAVRGEQVPSVGCGIKWRPGNEPT